MRASLDTNAIIHFYKAGLQDILFDFFDEGVFINPVIPPACAPQDTLVRFALMATHTKEQVDFAIEKLTKCFKQLDILK